MLCCGYTLTDFPISIRVTLLALWQSNDCPSASKATLMNMDKYFMWIHYERLHNHNRAKHNKTVCIFLGIYCSFGAYTDLSFPILPSSLSPTTLLAALGSDRHCEAWTSLGTSSKYNSALCWTTTKNNAQWSKLDKLYVETHADHNIDKKIIKLCYFCNSLTTRKSSSQMYA